MNVHNDILVSLEILQPQMAEVTLNMIIYPHTDNGMIFFIILSESR